jgi:hypothetical protein
MIVLVLEDLGDEIGEFPLDLAALNGLVTDANAAMAGNLAADAGNAQAAFPSLGHLLGALQDLGKPGNRVASIKS